MNKKPHTLLIPLNRILLIIFCAVIGVLFLIVTTIFYIQNQNIASDIASEFETIASEQVLNKFEQYIDIAQNHLKGLEELWEENLLNLEENPDASLVQNNLSALLNAEPNLNALYMANFNGNFYMAKRLPDGTISKRYVHRTEDKIISRWEHQNPANAKQFPYYAEDTLEEGYDPRKRPWYKNALETKITWSEPYIFFSDKKVGITATRLIKYDNFDIVIAVDIVLDSLSDFIDELFFSKYGTILVVDENDQVISYADNIFNINTNSDTSTDDESQIPQIFSLQDIEIGEALQQVLDIIDVNGGVPIQPKKYSWLQTATDYLFPAETNASIGSTSNFSIQSAEMTYQNEQYLYAYETLDKFEGLNWRFFFLMKASSVVGKYQNTLKLGILILILIFAIVLFYYSRFLKNFSRRIEHLSSQMNNITTLTLTDPYEGRGKIRITEVDDMGNVYNSVLKSLKSFKKFIPSKVIEHSIRQNQEIDVYVENKPNVSVLFSDIVSFTSITEQYSPSELAYALNIYFTELSQKIDSCNGIIDKFIGDAIMAIFGVFEDDKGRNHAEQACLAALKMQAVHKEINNLIAQNSGIRFATRIGINSGPALVGMVGSDTKLNYTSIGDTVNVASRLEGLNKQYETQIIISKATQSLLGPNFLTKKLDELQVKGKSDTTEIYYLYGYKRKK